MQGVPPSYNTFQHECSCDYISFGASSPGTVTYQLYQLFPSSVGVIFELFMILA